MRKLFKRYGLAFYLGVLTSFAMDGMSIEGWWLRFISAFVILFVAWMLIVAEQPSKPPKPPREYVGTGWPPIPGPIPPPPKPPPPRPVG